MALMEVLHFPHPVLRKKCDKVEAVDEEIKKIAADMAETMYAEKGIGLAAPQVGITKRIIVVDVDDALITLVNPEIKVSGEKEKWRRAVFVFPKCLLRLKDLPVFIWKEWG